MFSGVIYEIICVDKFNVTVVYSVNYIIEV
jgi:hypothetical protein